HEVAHGLFTLRHTFSNENAYILPQGTTDNLMDYSGQEATALYKYQWDLIHNPQRVWFAWLKDEEEGELLSEIQGTPVVFLGDSAIRKERIYVYNDTSKIIKVKFETTDSSKTKVAYQLITVAESNNARITYPKNGYDSLIFNEIKEITLDSIPDGKYTLICKVRVKNVKNKKEVETVKEFTTSFFIRKKKLEITKELLKDVFTSTDTVRLSKIAYYINKYSEEFGLVSINRMSHFLAQTGYESDGFQGKKGEGGCYTKTNANWKIWFSLTWKEPPFCNNCNCDITLNLPIQNGGKKLKWTAIECKKEEKDCYAVPEEFICKKSSKEQDSLFLSYVYQCEGGNGNSSTGDGYRYRGHGAIQLTWKKTYEAFAAWLKKNYPNAYKDVLSNPSIIDTDEELFILSAMWFWNMNNLNKLADDDNIKAITLKININGEGLKGRENYANQLKSSLK
ncbi:MAG TPA: hypothetical protein PLD12_12130, partial [Bacteroidales bacterium]|nr:hypothetical protein [Bacteroidales bacterium]